ncbi:MAG TPA: cell division protein FtsW, partial [Paraburkholderia sp.]
MSWSERFGSRLAGSRAGNGDTGSTGRASGRSGGSGLASAVNGVRPLRSRMLDYDHSLLWVVVAL